MLILSWIITVRDEIRASVRSRKCSSSLAQSTPILAQTVPSQNSKAASRLEVFNRPLSFSMYNANDGFVVVHYLGLYYRPGCRQIQGANRYEITESSGRLWIQITFYRKYIQHGFFKISCCTFHKYIQLIESQPGLSAAHGS